MKSKRVAAVSAIICALLFIGQNISHDGNLMDVVWALNTIIFAAFWLNDTREKGGAE